MFARRQRGQRHFTMEPVRRGDVHDIERGVRQHLAVIRVGLGNRQPLGGRFGQIAHIANGGHGYAQPPQGLDVHRANKTRANDACPDRRNVGLCAHSILPPFALILVNGAMLT